MDYTHLLETGINDRRQGSPEVAYGLGRYRPTCTAIISRLIIQVVRKGGVELNEVEEVRGLSYGCNVVVNPARDFGRAGLVAL
jgi:hypothetical protein